jgi:elongation factor Ts
MSVSAKDVKKLRDMTGAGMMDCKKALIETEGDLDSAVEYLQKKKIIGAGKKEGRVAAEGLIRVWAPEGSSSAVVLEMNSETDFVARNQSFIDFVDQITEIVGASDATNAEEALAIESDGRPVSELIAEQIGTIGENLKLRRVARVATPDGGIVGRYLHPGDQIGVLVALKGGDADLARDIAMHAAAMRPKYLSPEDVDADEAARQEDIFSAQLAEEGKPEHLIPRIMGGKMAKWRNEHSLLEQPFVKDPDGKSVGKFVAGEGAEIVEFVRFEVGEGIEKAEANLADEVAATLKG